MSDLTDFLLARLDEDEAAAQESIAGNNRERAYLGMAPVGATGDWRLYNDDEHGTVCIDTARVLAECEEKRRIVAELRGSERLYDELCDEDSDQRWEYLFRSEALTFAAKSLAVIYADHPDFREEWRA